MKIEGYAVAYDADKVIVGMPQAGSEIFAAEGVEVRDFATEKQRADFILEEGLRLAES